MRLTVTGQSHAGSASRKPAVRALVLRPIGSVRSGAFKPILEPANTLSQSFAEFGQLLRPEKQKGNSQDHKQVSGLQQVFHNRLSFVW